MQQVRLRGQSARCSQRGCVCAASSHTLSQQHVVRLRHASKGQLQQASVLLQGKLAGTRHQGCALGVSAALLWTAVQLGMQHGCTNAAAPVCADNRSVAMETGAQLQQPTVQ
jgi:hypothetical protein